MFFQSKDSVIKKLITGKDKFLFNLLYLIEEDKKALIITDEKSYIVAKSNKVSSVWLFVNDDLTEESELEVANVLTKIITAVICAFLISISKEKSFRISKKSMGLSISYSIFNSIGNLLLLIALLKLPSSVQYPMVTGGTIVFATVISVLRKDNVSQKEILAALIALGASVLMAF